jgi:hypothetical protein
MASVETADAWKTILASLARFQLSVSEGVIPGYILVQKAMQAIHRKEI